MTSLQVCEQFYSLQGEGATIGIPANFIRLQGCNLRCKWCDTKYTWKDNPDLSTSIQDIVDKLDKRTPRVVITGGEPLLWKDKGLDELVETLFDKRMTIEIETMGGIIPGSGSQSILDCVSFWNVSPKLINSQQADLSWPDLLNIYKESIPVFVDMGKDYNSVIFKFVVDSSDCLIEIYDFVEKYGIPNNLVYLMPQGNSKNEQLLLMPLVSQWCLERGWSMSLRLHCLIWDGKRGV